MKNSNPIEYKITRAHFDALLATRADPKINPYTYIMSVLNESYNLRGTVKKLHII